MDDWPTTDETETDDDYERDNFAIVPLSQRIEALHHACQSAIRLRGTPYHAGAHYRIDRLLDDIIGR